MKDQLHIKTPLIRSDKLERLLNKEVFLKIETLQPTGSFKNRGIGRLCIHYAKQGARCLISSSGGNAGLAAAYSGRMLGVAVKVVVPTTTLPMMRKKIEAQGAEVIIHGEQWSEADMLARSLVEQENGDYIPPFDHPLIWEGNATLIHEVAQEGVQPEAIVLAVGGGGLLCGIVQGMQDVGWPIIPLFAAEPTGAASLAAAMSSGKVISLESVDTIASSLAAKKVAEQAWLYTRHFPIFSQLVTDKQAIDACCSFAQDQLILVEPACGVALAPLYGNFVELVSYKSILVVVCGGSAVNCDLLTSWTKELSNNKLNGS